MACSVFCHPCSRLSLVPCEAISLLLVPRSLFRKICTPTYEKNCPPFDGKVLGVPVPQILAQIVDVPVPQLMKETVEAAKSIPEERTQTTHSRRDCECCPLRRSKSRLLRW